MAKKTKKKSDILLTLPEVAGVPEYSPDDTEGKEEAQQLMGGLTGSVPDVRNDFDPSDGTNFATPFNPYRIHESDTLDQQSDESSSPTLLTESESTGVDPNAPNKWNAQFPENIIGKVPDESEQTDLKKTMGDYSDRNQDYSLFKDLMEQKISPNSYGGAEFERSMEKAREAALADRPEVAAAFGADLQDIISPATEVAVNKGAAEGNEFQENRKNKQAVVSDLLSTANNMDQAANSNMLAANDLSNDISTAQTEQDNLDKVIQQKTSDLKAEGYSESNGKIYRNGSVVDPNSNPGKEYLASMSELVQLQNERDQQQTKIDNANKRLNPLVKTAQMQRDRSRSLMEMMGMHTPQVSYGEPSPAATTAPAATEAPAAPESDMQDSGGLATGAAGATAGKARQKTFNLSDHPALNAVSNGTATPAQKASVQAYVTAHPKDTQYVSIAKKAGINGSSTVERKEDWIDSLSHVTDESASYTGTSTQNPDTGVMNANKRAKNEAEANTYINTFLNGIGQVRTMGVLLKDIDRIYTKINSMGSLGTKRKEELVQAVREAVKRTLVNGGWQDVPTNKRNVKTIWSKINNYGFAPEGVSDSDVNTYSLWGI